MITNQQPIIDSRDVLARIAELEDSSDPGELAELSALRTLMDGCQGDVFLVRLNHPTVDFDGVTYWIRR
jgi:hypothetical protein